MISNTIKDTEIHMEKCVKAFEMYIHKVHAGRYSPNILNNIQIKYYGSFVPLYRLANVIIENSYMLVINVFDRKAIPMVEKAIIDSDLGFNPVSDGITIRISLSPLTEERRRKLIKIIRAEAEKGKISLRNIRRVSNDKIKFFLKNKMVNLDEERCLQGDIQKLTNFWIKKLDDILVKKESELMNF